MSKTVPLAQATTNCAGCRDDFYNRPGNSQNAQCWLLGSARLVWRWSIGVQTAQDRRENFVRVQVNTCYHGEGPYRDMYFKRLPAHLGGDWADKREQAEAQEAKP